MLSLDCGGNLNYLFTSLVFRQLTMGEKNYTLKLCLLNEMKDDCGRCLPWLV